MPAASGESINALSRRVLFDRRGMTGSTWLPNVDTGELGWILSSTARDMARSGVLWWLNGSSRYRIPGPSLLPSQPGALIPSAPADLVTALGKGDTKIHVVPSLELVVVRHGEEADASGGNPLAVSAFDQPWWHTLRLAFRY